MNALLIEEDWITVGCSVRDEVLYRIVVGQDREFVLAELGRVSFSRGLESPLVCRMKGDFERYLGGEYLQFSHYPVCLQVSPVARRVLGVLEQVPYGSVRTYKWLAERAGVNSPRAVGRIISANPLLVVLPCHRIIRSDGGLGGYSAGPGSLELKRRLLELEGVTVGS